MSTGSLQTLNSGDSLDGGAGNDTLYAIITSSATPTALTNIENVNITNTTANATFDLSNATGLSAVTNQASTFALTMAGISASGPTVTVRDTAIAGQVVTFNDVTGSADSATVVLNNIQSGSTLTVAGVETLTLNSDGSATNVLGTNAVVGLIAAAATRLNVTGSQGLTFATSGTTATATTNILPTTIVYLDASGNTSTTTGVTATMGSTNASTVVGGAGNDSLSSFSTGNDSVTMGAGNDTLWYSNSGTWTVADTVDGGDGTDTLRTVALSVAGIATPTTYLTTNIETIQISDALAASTYTPANISSTATTLNVTGNTNATGNVITTTDQALAVTGATIVGPAGDFKLGLGTSKATNTLGILAANGTTTITDTGTATTDSITITNNAMVTSGAMLNVFNGQTLPITGYETVTINTGSSSGVQQTLAAITVTGDSSASTTLNFTGVNAVQLTAATTATTIDASGITASGTGNAATTAAFFMTTGSTTGGTTITGSGGRDVLIGNTSSASSITAGAGIDVVTGGSGNDTILGGTGNDTITAGSGNDSIDAGDGDDTITMAGNLASGDVINGGAGTDTITASSAIAAAAAATISNVEVIGFTAAVAQDMTNFLNAGVTTLQTTLGTLAVTNAQSTLNTMIFGATAAMGTPSVTRLVDSSTSDTMNLLVTDSFTPTFTAVSMANEEIINIGEYGTDSTAGVAIALGTVTATSLLTLTVTGSNNNSLGLSGNTATTTINASAATGTFNLSANAGVTNQTITGSATNLSTLTGGSGNDSITGGALADSITAGTGADTVVGGAGADTIVGGAGADSFVGGDGTDTLDMNYTLAIDGGSVISTGYVINIGSSAVTATVVNAATATGDMATDSTTVAAGTVAILTGTPTTGSTRIDTVSGFENIIGSSGEDYIIGSSSANEITALGGLDIIFAGSGDDNINVTVGTDANTDVINGEAGTDTLVITTALTYTQATDASLQTVEQITLGATASVVLTGQTDGFTITGGSGINSIAASSIADTITDGAGADLIAGAAGADVITLATDAAADSIVFGNVTTLTAGADLAFGALSGSDTITGFTGGAGGDILVFDISGFGLAGSTEFVGLIGALTVDSSDEVVVLTAVGYATDELAEDAIAARVTTDGLDVVFIYFNTTDNTAHIVHDTNAGVDGTGTTTLIGTVNTTGSVVGGIATDFLVGNIDTIA